MRQMETSLAVKEEAKSCYICLESDNPSDLISPCRCSGTQKHVHRACLDAWRLTSARAFTHCRHCKMEYIFQEVVDTPLDQKRRKWAYRRALALDIVLFIGLNWAITFALGVVVGILDTKDRTVLKLFGDHPIDFGEHRFVAYSLCGVLLYFFFIGVYGLCLLCSECTPSSHHSGGGCNVVVIPSGGCGGGGSSKDECAGCLVVLAIIAFCILVFGIFIGIYKGCEYIAGCSARRMEQIWNTQELQVKVVKDFSGIESQLGTL